MAKLLEVTYRLRLYIAGMSPRSSRAIVNVRSMCELHLKGRYELEVVDISMQPAVARREQLIAAPTLVKELPMPVRRFVGDMSQTDRLLKSLGVTVVANKLA